MASKTGNHDIARRYAQAFFTLGQEKAAIDGIAADMKSLRKILAESEAFEKFIYNATLRRADQARALKALSEKAGFHALTAGFLGTLAAKRRIDALPAIIDAVEEQISRHKGEVTAHVTAAYALDKSQIDGIAAALKKALGMHVKVDMTENSEIMGGLVIRVGSQLIDSSVRTKLDRLHRALKSANTSPAQKKMKEVA